jgi:hypothetical protein
MNQAYWLDPIRSGELLRAVLRKFAGAGSVAVEGEAQALEALGLLSFPSSRSGPTPPFERQYKADSAVVIIPLENEQRAVALSGVLAPRSEVSPAIEAIQIESQGSIEFLAADGFHRECVSVGPAVPKSFLRELTRRGVIRGFYTPSEAREHFGLKQ